MTEFQEKLLQTFKVFAQFCKDNDITYYAAFGTCLGAVRHHGFIPWDDDMDVFMLRADYERLLLLRKQLENTKYRVSDIRDGEHPFPAGKFYSTDSSVWELRQFPFIVGPWIDIFPLDEWNGSETVSKLYDDYHYALWNYRKALSKQSWKEIWHDLIHRNGYNGLIKFVKKCAYSPFKKFFFNKVVKLTSIVTSIQGDHYKYWNHVKKMIYKKEWFNEIIEMPFEDTTIYCSSLYDEMLTYEYGDYMTPPPIEKRVSTHNLFYCNLKQKKSANEILEELSNKQEMTKTEAKPLSLKVILDELIHRKGF